MKEYQSLSHTRWDCRYPVMLIPKRRQRKIFGILRKYLGVIFEVGQGIAALGGSRCYQRL